MTDREGVVEGERRDGGGGRRRRRLQGDRSPEVCSSVLVLLTKEALRHLGMEVKGTTIAVQGFGNVGSVAAHLFAREGCRIVAIGDRSGAIYNRNGIAVDDRSGGRRGGREAGRGGGAAA